MKLNSSVNLIRILLTGIVIVVLSGCGGGNNSDQGVTDQGVTDDTLTDDTLTGYSLIWSEEFDGNSLDASKWNIETGYGPNDSGWGNDESQLYMNSSDNLKVEGGNLVITARCDSGLCGKRDGSITSAKINTKDKFEFKFGKAIARIKVPSGKSTWPAFWMLGANFPETTWPNSGEIDIMEVFQSSSNINTAHFATHWFHDNASPVPGWRFFTQERMLDEPLSDDFHEFETVWDENEIVGKIDGVTYYRKAIDPVVNSEFLKEFYMILNVAIDGTLGAAPEQIITTPQSMLVDWVRVYKSDGSDTGADSGSVSTFDGGLLEDGDFESGSGSWGGSGANIISDNNNLLNSANVVTAGNSFDVNLGQMLTITQGKIYVLAFKARTEGSRTIIAGIGLNEAPWTNDTELVTLTSDWQTFEYTLSAANFGSSNSRVFFDMGADTGLVLIDDVSLVEVVDITE